MTVLVPKRKNYNLLRGDIPKEIDMHNSSCGSCSYTACNSCMCASCGHTKVKKLITRK